MEQTPQIRFSVHLTLDPQPDGPRFCGHLGPGIAVFAEASVSYQAIIDLRVSEPITSRRLAAAFCDAAAAALETASSPGSGERSLEACRSLLIDAARRAYERFPEAAAKGVGYIEFSLFSARSGGRWRVFNIGSNVVLNIVAGGVSQVVKPNTPLYDLDLELDSSSQVWLHAGMPTAALEPKLEYADEIRCAEVELRPGDWLVVVPASEVALNLRLPGHPATLADVEREVIGRLAAPYAAYPRSWLSVHALPSEEAGAGADHRVVAETPSR